MGARKSQLVNHFPYRLATYSYLISRDFFGSALFQWSDRQGRWLGALDGGTPGGGAPGGGAPSGWRCSLWVVVLPPGGGAPNGGVS